MSRGLRWAHLLPLAMLLAGLSCSSQPGEPRAVEGVTTGAGMDIGFVTGTNPPVSGDNALEVTVKKDGAAVDDATVAVLFSMPAMPSMNMPEMRSATTLQLAGGGRYRGTGELSMAGTWNVRVTVTRNGEELGTKNLSIVAR